jgi:hypothetical protein
MERVFWSSLQVFFGPKEAFRGQNGPIYGFPTNPKYLGITFTLGLREKRPFL